MQAGYRVVVDVDLAKFFDRVNHDILIERLRTRIADAGVIRLVRAGFARCLACRLSRLAVLDWDFSGGRLDRGRGELLSGARGIAIHDGRRGSLECSRHHAMRPHGVAADSGSALSQVGDDDR